MINKIVICSNTSWYIYNFRRGLIDALFNKGYEIHIIAPEDDYSNRLESLGCKFHDIKIDNKGTNLIEDLKLIYKYYKIINKISPQLILTYTIKPNIYASFATKILGIRTINVIAGLGTVFLNEGISSKIARTLYKLALLKNSIIFENRDDYNEFVNRAIIEPKQATVVMGSGIDTKEFRPNRTKKDDKSLKFLFIARLIKDKGIIEYIDAVREIKPKYPNVKFQILGSFYFNNPSAISKNQLNSWVKEGIIEYLGYTDKVLEEIEKVDCVVLPSYREGLSRVLLEAGSMAKPIITTNVTGCREVVDDGVNGYLVPVKDSKALAKAIEKMINVSSAYREAMGKLSRLKVIKEFDDSIVISKYLNVIEKDIVEKRAFAHETTS